MGACPTRPESACHGGPAIIKDFHVRPAQIDHGLNGEEHALFQGQASARLAIVNDIGRCVEMAADPVPAEIPHNAATMTFRIGLNGVADIAQRRAGLHRRNAFPHGVESDVDQTFGLAARFAHSDHAAGVAMPAIDDQCDIDIDDVAVLQRLIPRNAMTDHVIDRGAA